MATKPKNLLPNASFELDFGDRVCTNWGDSQNELSLQVRAADQLPQKDPTSAAIAAAIDGARAARVETEAGGDKAVGHLLSPLTAVDSCAPHTISIYARSDQEGAQLEIGLWTGLVDFGRDSRVSGLFGQLRAAAPFGRRPRGHDPVAGRRALGAQLGQRRPTDRRRFSIHAPSPSHSLAAAGLKSTHSGPWNALTPLEAVLKFRVSG